MLLNLKNFIFVILTLFFFYDFGINSTPNTQKIINITILIWLLLIMISFVLNYFKSEYNLKEYLYNFKNKLYVIILSLILSLIIPTTYFYFLILIYYTFKFIEFSSKKKILNPGLIVFISFVTLSFVGGIFLYLPKLNNNLSLIDAFFLSTSAVCVTGLTPVDITETLTFKGLGILLLLIQIGAIGIMTFSLTFYFVFGQKSITSFKGATFLSQTLPKLKNIKTKNILFHIFTITFLVELLGTIFLAFINGYNWWDALFHSVSAFCNAGFSLHSNSFADYNTNFPYLIVIMTLIIIGGLGFSVITDIINNGLKGNKLSLNTKIVLTFTPILIIAGTLIFLFDTSIYSELGYKTHFMNALFLSITARTAGFNTNDLLLLNNISYIALLILMIIGASSGSTGGGIKVNTFAIIISIIKNTLKGEKKIHIFNRTFDIQYVFIAITILFLYFFCVIIATILLITTNPLTLKETLFEVISALSTVGLSLNVTPKLNNIGKIIIIILMLLGRAGTLTLSIYLLNNKKISYKKYISEKVLIG